MSHPALDQAARDLATASTMAEPSAELRSFLSTLASLERGQLDVLPHVREAFIAASVADVDRAYGPLHALLHDFELWLGREFYGDDWRDACEQRSRIEFVRSTYQDRMPDPGDHWMDPGEIDHMLRNVGSYEGCVRSEDIPAGTPESHWWWRLRAGA